MVPQVTKEVQISGKKLREPKGPPPSSNRLSEIGLIIIKSKEIIPYFWDTFSAKIHLMIIVKNWLSILHFEEENSKF